jgi:hypothetical protein
MRRLRFQTLRRMRRFILSGAPIKQTLTEESARRSLEFPSDRLG